MPMLNSLNTQRYLTSQGKWLRLCAGSVLTTALAGTIGLFLGFLLANVAGWV